MEYVKQFTANYDSTTIERVTKRVLKSARHCLSLFSKPSLDSHSQ